MQWESAEWSNQFQDRRALVQTAVQTVRDMPAISVAEELLQAQEELLHAQEELLHAQEELLHAQEELLHAQEELCSAELVGPR
jgi:hypothetical protein